MSQSPWRGVSSQMRGVKANHPRKSREITASDFDLRAQLHDLVGRDAEEFRRRAGVLGEEGEQHAPPAWHVGAAGRDEGLAAEEIAGAAAVRRESLRRRAFHDLGNVR